MFWTVELLSVLIHLNSCHVLIRLLIALATEQISKSTVPDVLEYGSYSRNLALILRTRLFHAITGVISLDCSKPLVSD